MSLGLLIADIHGVSEALEAVFATCPPDDFDFILNAGDALAYGPDPVRVLDLLDQYGVTSIRGNVDERTLAMFEQPPDPPLRNSDKHWIYQFTAQKLDKTRMAIVREWPRELHLLLDGQRIHLVHGSPDDFREELNDETPDSRWVELSEISQSDIVVCGHSHCEIARQVENTLFINPGTVGRPFNGDHHASCAILEIEDEDYQVEFLHVAYDWEVVLAKMQALNFPVEILEEYRLGGSMMRKSHD